MASKRNNKETATEVVESAPTTNASLCLRVAVEHDGTLLGQAGDVIAPPADIATWLVEAKLADAV